MKPILATSSTCGPCQTVKMYLHTRNINVIQKNMQTDIDFFKEMKIKSVPTLLVGDKVYHGTNDIIKYFEDEQKAVD